MNVKKAVRVALVGCGTVGSATASALIRDRKLIAERSGIDVELAAVVDRDFTLARSVGLAEELFCDSYQTVIARNDIDVIIELVGGVGIAFTIISAALEAGKHVVTANKALLAHRGEELFALARRCGVSIGFEASCGGGIPIIRAISEGLLANKIDALYGIVNGTCNFILTEMAGRGSSYADALADAQRAGLAEADPSLDVQGQDSAHKIAIMTALAFGLKVDFESIAVQGIDNLEAMDVAFGNTLGYVVKLLAVAHRAGDGVTLWVRPAFISRNHPLAWVGGPFNAVSVYGHRTGHTLYYGRGAGGQPTASAVIADILGIGMGTWPRVFEHTGYQQDLNTNTRQIPVTRTTNRFYVRVLAKDEPGVMGDITTILGRAGISIASVLQNEVPDSVDAETWETTRAGEALVPVVITTHRCMEEHLTAALRQVDALSGTGNAAVYLPIVEEHPERIHESAGGVDTH